MSATTVICEHCGETCRITDGFCQNCWKKLPLPEAVAEDAILDGYGVSEWRRFVDRNADRYIDVFKKHEGKRFFLHMNWAAFFFGMNWMLYRKMYKLALLSCVLFSLVSVLVSGLVMLPRAAEIQQLRDERDAYHRYLDADRDTVITDEYGNRYTPEVVERGRAAEKELLQIELQDSLMQVLLAPVHCLFWGLCGDAVYKAHVKKNILTKDGGTSVGAIFAGRFVISIIMELISLSLSALVLVIVISFA